MFVVVAILVVVVLFIVVATFFATDAAVVAFVELEIDILAWQCEISVIHVIQKSVATGTNRWLTCEIYLLCVE